MVTLTVLANTNLAHVIFPLRIFFSSYLMKRAHPPVTACEHEVVVYISNFIETFL